MMTAATIAYISLGGNQGDVAATFAAALREMTAWPQISATAVSRLFQTEPWGDPEQPWFVNQVVALSCGAGVTYDALLKDMLQLETMLGRKRTPGKRFGPRAIDLDLLLFGNIICTSEFIILPHPRMKERAFVLAPLLEIAPQLILPDDGRPVAEHLARLDCRVEGTVVFQRQTQPFEADKGLPS